MVRNFIDYFRDVDTSLRVLDIGCGDGFFMEILRDLGFDDLIGIDPSKVALIRARKKGLRVKRQSIYDLGNVNGEQYDVVVMADVIEHLDDPDLALRIISDVLVEGGILYLSTPVYDSIYRRLQRLLLGWTRLEQAKRWDETHIQAFSKSEVMDRVRRASFEVKIVHRFSNRLPRGEKISIGLTRLFQSFSWGGLFGDLLYMVARKRSGSIREGEVRKGNR